MAFNTAWPSWCCDLQGLINALPSAILSLFGPKWDSRRFADNGQALANHWHKASAGAWWVK